MDGDDLMLVCVTGGTGFLGAHSIAAIVRRGHRVRLLVRDESRVGPALAPLGAGRNAVEVAVGDVTDEAGVERAVRGADAVLHAAAVYSFDSRDRGAVRRVNERGTEVVLAAARRHGAGPLVHVSTFGVLSSGPGRAVRTDSPVGSPRETYLAAKAAAERVARRHQAEGAPVVIIYPPALLGPNDPRLGDQTSRLRNALRGLMPMWPLGGFPVGDVRDTAELHARLLETDNLSPARFFGPGRYRSTRQYVAVLREVTGHRLPTAFLPAGAMLPVGLLTDLIQRVWPWHTPAEYGAVYTCARAIRFGEDPGDGIEPRSVAETVEDTVRWLYRGGHLSAPQAGRAAERSSRVLERRR
jgi:nucleoside-diphosphate-sugar epimerase